MTTIPDKSIQNQIELKYQPVDFFYYNSNLTPSLVDCSNLMIFDCNQNNSNWNDISFNCYRQELCNNKNLANEILKSKNVNSETETRQNDYENMHNNSKLYTINLFGGIILMCILIGTI